MKLFEGRTPGTTAYLEVTLCSNLADHENEPLRSSLQVDVKLPHGKIMRLPYAWLMEEEATDEVSDHNPDPLCLECGEPVIVAATGGLELGGGIYHPACYEGAKGDPLLSASEDDTEEFYDGLIKEQHEAAKAATPVKRAAKRVVT